MDCVWEFPKKGAERQPSLIINHNSNKGSAAVTGWWSGKWQEY